MGVDQKERDPTSCLLKEGAPNDTQPETRTEGDTTSNSLCVNNVVKTNRLHYAGHMIRIFEDLIQEAARKTENQVGGCGEQ
jgi:hypothetical protein